MVVVFTAAFTSGFAGAYLEKMYKEAGAKKRSIWFRNAQLAFFSLPVAMIGSVWCDGERLRCAAQHRGPETVSKNTRKRF